MGRLIAFPPFQVDAANEQLWRAGEAVPLRPKSFALLRYLAERPGQLVTKDELLDALWPRTHVTDVVLKVCINELRQVLGDTAKAPRFIATVHRRGYRFVAEPPALPGASVEADRAPRAILVGRESELARLEQCLGHAMRARRQIVFVAGEAGIGKTTLIDAFLARSVARPVDPTSERPWISRGQCVAQFGAGEPFGPLLEGLGRLCRGADGAPLVACLRDLAPDWLLQLPGVLGPTERHELQRRAPAHAPDRMLRVMADALVAVTAQRPLVLVVEDLHWSDHGTMDLLAHVASRSDPARLLVLGTYRPAEAIVREHPVRALARDLQVQHRGIELSPGLLPVEQVTAYLAARFPDAPLPAELAAWLHERTDGNPLFLARVVDELVAQGLVVAVDGRATPQAGFERVGVPESLRLMIEQRVQRLSPDEKALLDAASVVGTEFFVAAVAAALGGDVAEVEDRCAALVRRGQVLRASGHGTWPDGTIAGRYAFVHALYREELYGRVPAARRAEMHRRVAERLVQAYGERAADVAAELALRFEEAGDRRRAIEALRRVAERAIGAGAHRDALGSLDHALELLAGLRDAEEREHQALALHHARGAALIRARGFAHPDVREAYEHAHALGVQLGDETTALVALAGRWSFHFFRREAAPMLEIAGELDALAARRPTPAAVLVAWTLMGITRVTLGELETARQNLEQAVAAAEAPAPVLFLDLRTTSLSCLSVVLLLLGFPDQARRRRAEALERARNAAAPFELALVLAYACELGCLLGDADDVERHAAEGEALASTHGFPLLQPIFGIARAWALALGRGARGPGRLERHLDEYKQVGSEAGRPFLLGVLAQVLLTGGKTARALECLQEARELAERTGERRDVADLWRLEGDCLLQTSKARRDATAEAGRCFRRAAEIASQQGARWSELRALTSLARLPLEPGRSGAARAALARLLDGFTEGDDTRWVVAARAALTQRPRRRDGHPARPRT